MQGNYRDQGDSLSRFGSLETVELLPDRYQHQKTLGHKAGRTTILALDQQTGNQVVIKLLTFSDEFQWEDLRLFEREMATLRSLDHPAIPRYLDSFEMETNQGKSIALVQSYIPAQSLEEYLQSGRQFVESEVRELLNSLLDILIYLHDRHPPVIHRDIKPSNILLGDRTGNSIGQVYLVDFGSVQTLATRAGQTMTVVGTYGYMPPEQFGGSAVPASDIYSLGCTALRLTTGSHPGDLPQRNLQIQFTQYTDLSPSFTTWLQNATHPSLDKRFSQAAITKQELNHPLEPNPRLPFLVSRKPANSSQSFWIFNFLWRSTVLGAVTGGIYGGMFRLALPSIWNSFTEGRIVVNMFGDEFQQERILGTLLAAVYGSLAGCLLGFFNSIVLTIFTYSRSNKGKYYPYWMAGLGFFGLLSVIGWWIGYSDPTLNPLYIRSYPSYFISIMNSILIVALSTILNGILIMIFTHLRSNKQNYLYRIAGLGLLGFLGCLGLLAILQLIYAFIYFFNRELDSRTFEVIFILIAALSMGLISYTIARWYQKHVE